MWGAVSAAAAQTAAPQSRALLEILQKAAELFPQDMGRQSAPPKEEPADRNEDAVNPFPEAFPFSRWKRISYPGTDRYYLEGGGPYAGSHIPDTRPAGGVPPRKEARGLRQIFEGEGRRRILGKGEKGAVTTHNIYAYAPVYTTRVLFSIKKLPQINEFFIDSAPDLW